MNRLEQLTASPKTCERLVNLGVIPLAIIWHLFEEDDKGVGQWDTCLLNEPVYVPEFKIPAWTKAEIDAMIGPDFPKPDFFTREQFGLSKTLDPLTYPVIFPETMQVYQNGAEASANGLAWLIEKKHIKIEDANERYSKRFRVTK